MTPRGQRYGQILQSRFRPHPLLPGAHLQTIATLLRPAPKLVLRRERLELSDGDFVDLGWSGDHNASGPLAVLVHGLAGGFESKYLLGNRLPAGIERLAHGDFAAARGGTGAEPLAPLLQPG